MQVNNDFACQVTEFKKKCLIYLFGCLSLCCGMQDLLSLCTGPPVVVHRLSCSEECGTQFFDQGSNLHPLALQGSCLTPGPPGKSQVTEFLKHLPWMRLWEKLGQPGGLVVRYKRDALTGGQLGGGMHFPKDGLATPCRLSS